MMSKEAPDCSTNSPCQHLRKCIENSRENIQTDVREYSIKLPHTALTQ